MSAPSLGIVVPTLNAAATIGHTLLALRAVAAAGAQVVVVDGGSSDGTLDIVHREGVHVLHRNGGMYAALNAGFRHVQGEWLTWINADDLLFPDVLWSRIAEAADAAVTYGPVDFVDGAGRFVHCWRSAPPQDLLALYRAGYSPLLQQGTLFRRRVYEALHGFEEEYQLVADADFWWRALEHGFSFVRTSHPTVAGFRLHADQLSQKYAGEMRNEHSRMVMAHGGRRHSAGSWWALCRYRGHNLSGYLVRMLRRRDLEGRVRLVPSYALVGADKSMFPHS